MSPHKHFRYYDIAKQMGVPNIILTGIENRAKIEFPDNEEMYAIYVLKKLKSMADDPSCEWSRCDLTDDDLISGPEHSGENNSGENPVKPISIRRLRS